ncbi:YraN family protein [Homoserinimonas sp. OAct 916]|uniref:YraN family protein n=1 Tax=Homoserinimonas sp. OAct 916 TaxID=2211450 RepID=UPI000DBE50A4|nr:YraN family protein [Homoserinimonas sp. OAct 916]
MAGKDDLGRMGEELAARYLVEKGYAILDRNWRCDQGEIDIIAWQGGEVVFVEVKTRSGLKFGHPFEAITTAKLARMNRLAYAWCAQGSDRVPRIRVDVIAVIAPHGSEPQLEHLERVF